MRGRVHVSAVLVFLSGCAAMGTPVELTSQFNVKKAEKLLEPGPNTITGSALIRQRGGGVVHCGGNDVRLVPVTEYATERIRHIYGNEISGYHRRTALNAEVKFKPDISEYYELTRNATCDAQGSFKFEGISDGEYYLISGITWTVGYAQHGGTLMERVSVSNGETKQVVLSP